MRDKLTDKERADLRAVLEKTRRVREWRRYRAVLLWDDGQTIPTIAQTLQLSEASVYNYVARYRAKGLAGLHEGVHPGLAHRLDAAGMALLEDLLQRAPEAYGYALTGWTVPALHTEVSKAGYRLSSHTVRRAIWRLGWRWKRPKFVLGRPDPHYAEKKRP